MLTSFLFQVVILILSGGVCRWLRRGRVNVFVLDRNPLIAARMQCNKHVVKMV